MCFLLTYQHQQHQSSQCMYRRHMSPQFRWSARLRSFGSRLPGRLWSDLTANPLEIPLLSGHWCDWCDWCDWPSLWPSKMTPLFWAKHFLHIFTHARSEMIYENLIILKKWKPAKEKHWQKRAIWWCATAMWHEMDLRIWQHSERSWCLSTRIGLQLVLEPPVLEWPSWLTFATKFQHSIGRIATKFTSLGGLWVALLILNCWLIINLRTQHLRCGK